MKDWPTDPTFPDGSPNPMVSAHTYTFDPDAGDYFCERCGAFYPDAPDCPCLPPSDTDEDGSAYHGDVERWQRDEERLAESPGYCRCGAHVLGTPCYSGRFCSACGTDIDGNDPHGPGCPNDEDDRGLDHLWIALAMQAEADDYRAEANAAFVWDSHIFRTELERELTLALRRDRQEQARKTARTRHEFRRAAVQAKAEGLPPMELHRLEATPTIPATEDYFSAAPKTIGEEQDVMPDEADPDLALAAKLLAGGHSERTIERLTGYTAFEAETIPFRTADDIGLDLDTLDFLHRDEAPAPRGYGMTTTEMRRKWVMDAREVYREKLAAALLKHRKRIAGGWLTKDEVKAYPALVSEEQLVQSVIQKWRFVDALQRHGIFNPDAETTARLKKELCEEGGFKVNFHNAAMELEWRVIQAQRGQYDRELNPLVPKEV